MHVYYFSTLKLFINVVWSNPMAYSTLNVYTTLCCKKHKIEKYSTVHEVWNLLNTIVKLNNYLQIIKITKKMNSRPWNQHILQYEMWYMDKQWRLRLIIIRTWQNYMYSNTYITLTIRNHNLILIGSSHLRQGLFLILWQEFGINFLYYRYMLRVLPI